MISRRPIASPAPPPSRPVDTERGGGSAEGGSVDIPDPQVKRIAPARRRRARPGPRLSPPGRDDAGDATASGPTCATTYARQEIRHGSRRMCFDRVLPRDLRRTIRFRTLPGPGQRTRAITSIGKLWMNGSTLRVRFVDGTSAQRDRLEQFAPRWTDHANLHFEFGAGARRGDPYRFRRRRSLVVRRHRRPRHSRSRAHHELRVVRRGGRAARVRPRHRLRPRAPESPPAASSGTSPSSSATSPARRTAGTRPPSATTCSPSTRTTRSTGRSSIRIRSCSTASRSTGRSTASIASPTPSCRFVDQSFAASAQMYPGRAAPEETELTVAEIQGTRPASGRPGEEDLYTFQATRSRALHGRDDRPTDLVMKLFGPESRTQLVAEDDDGGQGINPRIMADLSPGPLLRAGPSLRRRKVPAPTPSRSTGKGRPFPSTARRRATLSPRRGEGRMRKDRRRVSDRCCIGSWGRLCHGDGALGRGRPPPKGAKVAFAPEGRWCPIAQSPPMTAGCDVSNVDLTETYGVLGCHLCVRPHQLEFQYACARALRDATDQQVGAGCGARCCHPRARVSVTTL